MVSLLRAEILRQSLQATSSCLKIAKVFYLIRGDNSVIGGSTTTPEVSMMTVDAECPFRLPPFSVLTLDMHGGMTDSRVG